MNFTFFTLARIGLIFNFFGTIAIAWSVGKNPEDAHSEDQEGRPVYLASVLYPRLFKYGLIVVAIGFILQLFA